MNEKTRELIAVGASVSAHCQPCLTYHVAKAKEMGVEETEIREAIAVGHLVEKGAMSTMRQFSASALGAPPSTTDGSCCGGGREKAGSCCG